MTFEIRPAEAGDMAAIKALMEPVIRETTASFASYERSAQEWADLAEARRKAGRPFDVAVRGGEVLGWASYDQFRGNDGYRFCMEHSVYIAAAARGTGMGRALMTRVEDHARTAGHHSMMGGIDGDNTGSIDFHLALGYRAVARVPQVGFKFGRWLDLVLMQKML